MKDNELRVENLLNHKTDGVIVVNAGVIACVNSDFMYEPIPLTEEWLIKLNFKKVIGWDSMVFWVKEDEIGNYDRFELLETKEGYELPSGSVCPSVHLLQNCYYFHYLTGLELTIND